MTCLIAGCGYVVCCAAHTIVGKAFNVLPSNIMKSDINEKDWEMRRPIELQHILVLSWCCFERLAYQ